MTGRRRPGAPRGRDRRPAAETLELRLVEAERPRLTLGRVAGQMLGGLVRQTGIAPYRVEVVERATGRVLATEPVDGTEGQARERLALMRDDLDALDDRAFLRKWRRHP